jgi:hypothetical protein
MYARKISAVIAPSSNIGAVSVAGRTLTMLREIGTGQITSRANIFPFARELPTLGYRRCGTNLSSQNDVPEGAVPKAKHCGTFRLQRSAAASIVP